MFYGQYIILVSNKKKKKQGPVTFRNFSYEIEEFYNLN